MLNPLVRAPQPADLAAPVGTIMRPTLTVETGDSLARGAQALRENGGTVLPVVDETGRLQGVLTDAGLARALAEATEPTDAVVPFLVRAETVAPYASGAEALRRGEHGDTLVVVDDARRPVGLVSAVDLWPRRRALPRPAMVGGMATPFGVYLTTGNVSAGAPWWALGATGAAMFALLTLGQSIALLGSRYGLPVTAVSALGMALFFLLMRLAPLSGVHGAEHMVVNAIEREEALTVDVVRRMPLVHPRCGTNLLVGISIFMAVLFIGLPGQISWDQLSWRVLPAVVLGVVFARPLGAVVQRYVTTKRPTDAQLAGAVRAGEALLRANATARQSATSTLRRVWCMGLIQVMAGAILTAALFGVLRTATGWTWLPEVGLG